MEAAAHPILIYTDYKSLECLISARRLKPGQARWALFFFMLLLPYYLLTWIKNIKLDALSCMYNGPKDLSVPDTILPATANRSPLLNQRSLCGHF